MPGGSNIVASGALAAIDTQRGPTWKDKVVAWSHQLVGACPEYAMLMGIVRDLLVQLMDSILAFVLSQQGLLVMYLIPCVHWERGQGSSGGASAGDVYG